MIIWNNDIDGNLEGVGEKIYQMLMNPHPGPLPGGEGVSRLLSPSTSDESLAKADERRFENKGFRN
jgi:hypothetical protein